MHTLINYNAYFAPISTHFHSLFSSSTHSFYTLCITYTFLTYPTHTRCLSPPTVHTHPQNALQMHSKSHFQKHSKNRTTVNPMLHPSNHTRTYSIPSHFTHISLPNHFYSHYHTHPCTPHPSHHTSTPFSKINRVHPPPLECTHTHGPICTQSTPNTLILY